MPFEIFQSEKSGKYYFRLKATNGQVILASEAYERKAGAENGIRSVIKNAQNEDRFEKKESRYGDPYFTLRASNGQAIGKSEMYSSKAAMEKGIRSVQNNSTPKAAVKDLTPEAKENELVLAARSGRKPHTLQRIIEKAYITPPKPSIEEEYINTENRIITIKEVIIVQAIFFILQILILCLS